MHAPAQDRNGDLARKAHVMTAALQKQSHARTLCKLPQYQMFKIDRKFIHLILLHKSIRILLLKQQQEHSHAM